MNIVRSVAGGALLAVAASAASAATLMNRTELRSGNGVTSLGGCTAITTTRVELFCNGDGVVHTNSGFATVPGQYRMGAVGNYLSGAIFLQGAGGVA